MLFPYSVYELVNHQHLFASYPDFDNVIHEFFYVTEDDDICTLIIWYNICLFVQKLHVNFQGANIPGIV